MILIKETAVSTLSSGEKDKHKYLTGKKINKLMQEVYYHKKFEYSPLAKAFKTQRRKPVQEKNKLML